MAFPQMAESVSGVVTSNSNNWTLTYPGSITSDSLLLLGAGIDGGPTATLPAGWQKITETGTTARLLVAYKFADGTETGDFSLSLTASEQGVWRIWRIEGAHDTTPPAVGTAATGTSANPNPPLNNPAAWDVEDVLWWAFVGSDDGRPLLRSLLAAADRSSRV